MIFKEFNKAKKHKFFLEDGSLTLKHKNKKSDKEEVFRLVQELVKSKVTK